MEIVFLPNGQACYLKEKIDNRYLVNKIFQYEDEEIIDTNDILVDIVYPKPPIEKIDTEVKELQNNKNQVLSEINELKTIKHSLKNEIEQITKTQISNNKFIINRTELLNAKTLALFIKDRPIPITMNSEDKSFRGLRISLNIEISTGIERKWGYKLYYDYDSSGDYLCEKYGVLINPTQEEIDEVIMKRLSEFEFSDYYLKNVDDKYLTPKLIEQKNQYILSQKIKQRDKLQKELQEIQEKISKLC